ETSACTYGRLTPTQKYANELTIAKINHHLYCFLSDVSSQGDIVMTIEPEIAKVLLQTGVQRLPITA
ncbi:hypothetical protein, partial [Chamaesiphon sp. OTE_75_metabat_556]|uniref:hypothetical protein n=1 Tax=Chamaesiphon sp. OTE_75_metabat_556 TaxID=2964692 RepID=UPI00286B8A65